MKIFSPFSIFEQLALVLKNRLFSEIFSLYWLYTFYQSGIFEQLCACPEKQIWPEILHCIEIFLSFKIFEQLRFALKIFTVSNIPFKFRNFEQLALALKNRVGLKFFAVLKYLLLFRILSNFRLPWKHNLHICRGTFKVSNRREIYIYIYCISKYLYIYQWILFSKAIACLLLNISMIYHDKIFCHKKF